MCTLCGGRLVLLGKLGMLNHYRCRSRGMLWSKRVPERTPRIGRNPGLPR